MIKINKDNKNIFQICINLNDNVDSLKKSRRKLLDLNPDYDFHYITSQEEFEEFMQIHFKNSEDVFEQKIYEVFNCIPNKLHRKAPAPDEDIEKLEKAFQVCVLVSRTDVFRYAALYKFGGFYLDLSSFAEVDMKQELEKYDCVFLRSLAEIRSSICYAKKHSFVIKTILENIIFHCLSRYNVMHQMRDVGPGVVTETIFNIIDGTPFNEFKQFNNDETRNKLEKINEFSLEKHNSIVLFERDVHQKYKVQASWKKELHTPDPSRPELIPNHHWLGWF